MIKSINTIQFDHSIKHTNADESQILDTNKHRIGLLGCKRLKITKFSNHEVSRRWHSHQGSEILISIDGTGYYQEKGGQIKQIMPGDVITFTPGVHHWHIPMPDSEFSEVNISVGPDSNSVVWLQRIQD